MKRVLLSDSVAICRLSNALSEEWIVRQSCICLHPCQELVDFFVFVSYVRSLCVVLSAASDTMQGWAEFDLAKNV